MGLWSTIRFLHVLSAAVWVGGQLTISGLIIPAVRRRVSAAVAPELLTEVGKRFGIYTVTVFLPVQITTGVLIARHKGVTWESLTEPGYGRTLGAKLLTFVLVMTATAAHGWANVSGRKALARSFALASLFGSVVIVLLATALPPT